MRDHVCSALGLGYVLPHNPIQFKLCLCIAIESGQIRLVIIAEKMHRLPAHLLMFFTVASKASAILRVLPPSGSRSIPSTILSVVNVSDSITTPPSLPIDYLVECFNPYLPNLRPAAVEDCRFVIDHIITSYGDPWLPRSFGYTPDVDIDLDEPENNRWALGRCAVFVKNLDRRVVDTFRMVDVGQTATRILRECVMSKKYPFGGTAGIGSIEGKNRFYVALGGLSGIALMNGTILSRPLRK